MNSNNGKEDLEGMKLTELVSIHALQKMQDSFADLTNMAVQVVDMEGNHVTEISDRIQSGELVGSSPADRIENARPIDLVWEDGSAIEKAQFYESRDGLILFTVPLKLNGQQLGTIISGPVPQDISDHVKSKQNNADKKTLKKEALSLIDMAEGLSDIASRSYMLNKNSHDAENASKVKSDFLANMSHEIRTPMNAVLGMVDLALREDMPDQAREYVSQIRVAGKNLLGIINDILDFSKIESGKMEIISEDYELLSVVGDVANIINTRVGDKEIEFTMNIDPDVPKTLNGDGFHLHQIFVNILNNGVKFTRKGNVCLNISVEYGEGDDVTLVIKISDTGIGIKEEDKKKLFVSFQQVDSKRNRNIEGTGLGLAITQRLLSMMNGSISFESEYGKGTDFFIRIPQKCVIRMPDVPKPKEGLRVLVKLDNKYVKQQLETDLGRVGIKFEETDSLEKLYEEKPDFFFIDKNEIDDELLYFFEKNPELKCLAVADFSSRTAALLSNVDIIRKPIYSLALYNAMGLSDIELFADKTAAEEFKFVAPTAQVLIVDDNSVNLTVAKGLLGPLKMKVDLALNAGEAIELLMEKEYDVIFMDHMMPEVDGIEATHIIRRLMPEYDDIPIIALTANAVNGAREMFIAEGMSDFVAKPIDLKDISAKLYKWLPKEKIVPVNEKESSEPVKTEQKSAIVIPGLDTATAVSSLGGEELYMTVLNEYYRSISSKAETIRKYYNKQDIRNYTVEVHSLKSTSRQIGAHELGELAAEMEAAGKSGSLELIAEKTEPMLEMYCELKETLRPYVTVDDEPLEHKTATADAILELFENLAEALSSLDTLEIDDIVEKLSGFDYPTDKQREYLSQLQEAANITDIDTIEKIIFAWKQEL